MLTEQQRRSIIIWSSYTLLVASVLMVLVHGLLYFSVLQYYLYVGMIVALTYCAVRYHKLIEDTVTEIFTQFIALIPKRK